MTRSLPARPGAPRTRALTVVTPIKPGRAPLQRLILEVLPLTRWGRSDDLLRLSFIQSARWSLITGFADNGALQVPERLRYDYLLFESNFNGPLDAYIEAFSDVMPQRMDRIWRTSYGYPGARPLRPFLDYIRRTDAGADHFFAAYPATNTEVLAALAAGPSVRALAAQAAGLRPEAFRRRYEEVLVGTQARPAPLRPRQPARGDRSGQTYAFTALTPVRPGLSGPLREVLHEIEGSGTSPFAPVPGVHFARWVVLDDARYQGAGQRRDSWRNAYLLTTTTSDGGGEPIERLQAHLGDDADLVFDHCVGYPGRADGEAFARYLRRNQIRTNRFVAGYPEASVLDVLAALGDHERLLGFAQQHPDSADPARLRAEFLAAFGTPAATPATAGRAA